MKKGGKLIIFSAPSGSGKTTIVKHLLNKFDGLAFSVSACTRQRRIGEIDGRDYYFLDIDLFKEKVHNSEFVEHEEVYPGSFYGTLKSEIDRLWDMGKHVLFDIDVEGGLNIKKQYGEKALSVFVKPASIEVLKERLYNRSTETALQLEVRLNKAVSELKYENEFDSVLVNADLKTAFEAAEALVSNFTGLKPKDQQNIESVA
ncbi:MAG: guanylate kinase [Bacteroidota bacterium]|nr:guanylate kinase [Bacteroidota bacterium]